VQPIDELGHLIKQGCQVLFELINGSLDGVDGRDRRRAAAPRAALMVSTSWWTASSAAVMGAGAVRTAFGDVFEMKRRDHVLHTASRRVSREEILSRRSTSHESVIGVTSKGEEVRCLSHWPVSLR
jgi:hypothetical protein